MKKHSTDIVGPEHLFSVCVKDGKVTMTWAKAYSPPQQKWSGERSIWKDCGCDTAQANMIKQHSCCTQLHFSIRNGGGNLGCILEEPAHTVSYHILDYMWETIHMVLMEWELELKKLERLESRWDY